MYSLFHFPSLSCISQSFICIELSASEDHIIIRYNIRYNIM